MISSATLGKLGAVLAAAVVAAVGVFVVTGGDAAPSPGARAWFDQPLDATYFESGPVHVVAHAAHPEGVVDVVLSANDEEVAVIDAGGDRLVDVELDWEPPSNGVFTLHVVGRDNDGDLTAPDVVTIGIGVDPVAEDADEVAAGPDETTAPEEGTGPTESSLDDSGLALPDDPGADPAAPPGAPPGAPTPGGRPAPTTTQPSTPTCPGVPEQLSVTVPGSGFAPRLHWRYLGCAPDQFEIEVSTVPSFVQGPDQEYRQGLVPGAQRQWDVSPRLTRTCTTYYWHVRARLGRDLGPWSATQTHVTPCR